MHRSPVLVVAALGLAIATAASAREPTRPYARQLDADSIAHLQPQGPHAITGLGDWVLSNGVLCAGITKLGRPGRFSLRGGSLVDLGFCCLSVEGGRAPLKVCVLDSIANLCKGGGHIR